MKVQRTPEIDHEVAPGALGFEVDEAINSEKLVAESGASAVIVEGPLDEGGIVWVVGLDEQDALSALERHDNTPEPQDDDLAALKAKAVADEKLTPAEMQQAVRALLRRA